MSHYAYYNEIDPWAAAWLRNLIRAGQIMDGEVDERSIEDVDPDDVRGFTRCHFFAGIGGWDLACQIAEIPEDLPIWTGSCPCQPLSSAGQGKGHADQRHLWPAFYELVSECRPRLCFGEQVASKLGREWMSAVRADLERVGYACGASDLPAACVGAPHIRQRLWWVGHANSGGRKERRPAAEIARQRSAAIPDGSNRDRLAHPEHPERGALAGDSRTEGRDLLQQAGEEGSTRAGARREDGGLGDPDGSRLERYSGHGDRVHEARRNEDDAHQPAAETSPRLGSSPWDGWELIRCADGKARPAKPGIFPLVDGLSPRLVYSCPRCKAEEYAIWHPEPFKTMEFYCPDCGDVTEFEFASENYSSRIGLLRGYGNAIIPSVAAVFIRSAIQAIEDTSHDS